VSAVPDALRALASDCVHCGFCLPTCPTYLLWSEEMDSPRGRIHLIEAQLDGTASLNSTVIGHFDLCLGCLACVTSCPSGVRYDLLIEATRETVETQTRRPLGDRLVRGTLFALLPYPRRMGPALRLASVGRKLPLPGRLGAMTAIAPPWRSTEKPERTTPARGETRGRVAILTGCVQSVVFGSVNAATARVLAADGYEVVAPPQGCCGALSLHASRGDEGRAFARQTIEAFEGVETVIVNTSGCGSHLKELGHVLGDDPAWADRAAAFSARVRDLGEFLAGVTPRAPRHPLNLTVAMQDPCHLRHAQRLPLSSATSLARIPGLRVIEPAEQDVCCGSAGTYNVTQESAARQLGDRKAAHVLATGAQAYASANPGCLVQVATALRRAGNPLPSLHPIELVDASIRNLGAAGLLRQARR
jgi:glycolate oxidase iron-sulfur subunit